MSAMPESWRALVDDAGDRARIAAAARELEGALAAMTRGERDVIGCCDRAVACAYVAPEDDDGEALALAAGALAHAKVVALSGGAARVGWTLAHLADGDDADQILAAIDAAVLRQLDAWRGTYDLASGLVGLGVYALERGAAGRPIASRVLARLAELAQPRGGGLAWYTAPELMPDWQRELAPAGYWNLGLAHGTPGVIVLAARCVAADIDRERAHELLAGATTYLLATVPPNAGPRFPPWHVDGRDVEARPGLAWCYGDLGVSAALLAAAQVDGRWREPALALALGCARRACDIPNAAICHGSAGVAHILNRMWQATGDASFATAARAWLDRALAGVAELRAASDPTLLDGAAGVALVLHAAVSDIEPEWDRLLLLSG